jgi:hypothetical protein
MVFIALDRHQRLDASGLAGVHVGCAEVPGVGEQLLGLVQTGGERLKLLEHGHDLLLVVAAWVTCGTSTSMVSVSTMAWAL